MIEGLIGLLIVCIVIAVIAAVILYCINLLPIAGNFQQIIRVQVILIAALIIIAKALPLLGVAL